MSGEALMDDRGCRASLQPMSCSPAHQLSSSCVAIYILHHSEAPASPPQPSPSQPPRQPIRPASHTSHHPARGAHAYAHPSRSTTEATEVDLRQSRSEAIALNRCFPRGHLLSKQACDAVDCRVLHVSADNQAVQKCLYAVVVEDEVELAHVLEAAVEALDKDLHARRGKHVRWVLRSVTLL